MSQLFNGSICLSDIPKESITVSESNGKKYLNINVWVNDDVDRYNNIGSIQVSQTKEQREAGAKKVYIGNLKNTAKQQQVNTPAKGAPANDDLPF